ncbi:MULTISPECIES: sensor histidine kinase [Enterococcus]|uniref:sensor histidine kinase n=1 Tax=Enterococcus TaxID=1350 RepID=UPI001F5042B0|nr:ATP-binding protein [Enterococcus faecalis]MCI0138437.1 ATP-binding protein [Enterococcus faecalis]MDN3181276.1 ATP-binding protein [Enterococcus faecalis]
MDKRKKVGIGLKWLVTISYIAIYSAFMEKEMSFLSLLCSIYIIFLGSFVYIKLPEKLYSLAFFSLNFYLGWTVLLVYSDIWVLKLVGLFLLCCHPLTLYLFLYSFIHIDDKKKLNKNRILLCCVSLYSYLALLLDFYVGPTLILLMISSITVNYLTIIKEKKFFFSELKYKVLITSLLLSFVLLILFYFICLLSPELSFYNWDKITILVTILPTGVVYILVKEREIILSEKFLLAFCILVYSAFFFLILEVIGIVLWKSFILTILFTLVCYLTHLSINAIHSNKVKQLKNNFRNLNNEKLEVLDQVTYSQFLNNVSELLLDKLEELTASQRLAVFVESKEGCYLLCQKGEAVFNSLKKEINSLKKQKQKIKFRKKEYTCIPIIISGCTVWVFFENNDNDIDLKSIHKTVEQHGTLIITVRLLHLNSKSYVKDPIEVCQLLRIKLFNSMEIEKKNYANYLHDNILQSVIGLHTLISNLSGDVMVMDLINEEFSKLVSSIRSEIFNTYPSTLYHLTFKENLQILIDDFNKKYPNTEFILDYSIEEIIPQHVIAPLYRIVKELNENIGKHADAEIGKVTVEIDNAEIQLIVEDDGVGVGNILEFEKSLIQTNDHIGLLSIKNDINWLNGSFKMLSLPGPNSGTKVWVTIPCMKGEQYENITS